MAFITGIGTAVPATRYTQAQCWDAIKDEPQFLRLDRRARATVQKVLLGDSGVATRTLVLDPLTEAFDNDADTLHARFAKHAPLLASNAARAALDESGADVRDIDALVVSTCTGYLCPGLTSYVGEALGLRGEVLALDLVGQGCGAALPNLATADALILSGRCGKVLSVCVEVCSAAYYLDDDPGVLISACLFADGAGAAVLSRDAPPDRPAPEWTGLRSMHNPGERDALRFEQRNGMLRNILTARVPLLAADHAERVLDAALDMHDLARGDIVQWIWHAGGKRVLAAVADKVGLSDDDIAVSRSILAQYGNLSSAFVYFVLQQTLRERRTPGWWWMSSFGAGFSCHGALLRVAA
ncbi:MAG: type III polyketide synthase [Rhodospirillaceae bacterium]